MSGPLGAEDAHDPAKYADFAGVVQQMVSCDNETRTRIEASYFQLLQNAPSYVIAALARMICDSSVDAGGRQLAYMLLKNTTVIPQGSEQCAALAASPEAIEVVKAALLHAFANEPTNALRYKLLYCMASYAGLLVPLRKWDDLMGTLIEFARSSRPDYASLAIRVVTTLATDLRALMESNIGTLVDLLQQVLPIEDQQVRAASLEYFGALLSLSSDAASGETMINLIPAVLTTIGKSVLANDWNASVFGIDAFIAIAETHPLFLKKHLHIAFDTMLSIAEANDVKGRPRRLAMEFICTMAEVRIGLLRRHGSVLQRSVPLLLQWLTNIKDISMEEWESTDEDDFKRCVRIGRDDLDRLAVCFKDEAFLSQLYSNVTEMLGNPQWQVRHGALMAMLCTCEGLAAQLQPNIEELVVQMTPLISDPHPRVRWQALGCLSQMCIDVSPHLQNNAHAAAMRCIFTSMQDSSVRVRVQAASAIVNFCEVAEVDIVVLYVDELLEKLGEMMHMSAISAQEWALTAIAALASACKQHFVKFVDAVMPLCLNIVRGASSTEYRLLRGRAFEAATHIGVAVGRERFVQYADELMTHLLNTDLNRMSSDDPQVRLLIDSSTRIAQLMGEDFAPYLPRVMESLTERATTVPMVREIQDDEEEDEGDDEWDYHEMDGRRFAIHQPSLEDKADALQALARYADYVGVPFAPFVQPIADHILENIEMGGNERVQETSTSILPFLVHSVAKYADRNPHDAAAQASCTKLTNDILACLCRLICDGDEVSWQHLYVQTVCELTDNLSKTNRRHILTFDTCSLLIDSFKTLVDEALARREDRNENRNDEDHDEDLEADFHEEEDTDTSILVNCTELLENTLKLQGALFVPQWQGVIEYAEKWLSDKNALPIDLHLGVCLLDDVVEHGEAAGLEFFDEALRQQMRLSVHPDEGVRQAALFGLGVSSIVGGTRFSPHVEASLQLLLQTIEAPGVRDKEATAQVAENALSAVGKIVLSRPQEVPALDLVSRFVSHLPIVVDEVEAIVVYNQLLQFVELYPTAVFGGPPTTDRIRHVLYVIGTALETACVDDKVTAQFSALLKHMQQALPQNELGAAFGSLEEIPRARLQRALEAP